MATLDENLAQAIEHHRAGRIQDAEQIYRQILAAQPRYPEPWYLLGMIANQVGKPDVAVQCLEQALALKPDYADAHYNLGNALRQSGKLDDAISSYRRAIELNGRITDAHNNLGLIFFEQRKLSEAAACFRKAIELESSVAGFHFNLGLVLHEEGKLNDAAACFLQAIQLDPHSADAHYKLAGTFKQQKNLEAAVAFYRRALELKQPYVEACTDLGVALHDQGKFTEAEACHRQSLAWKPDSFETHNNLGSLYQDQAKLDEAHFHYLRALELKPDAPETHVNLGISYKRFGRFDEACSHYNRALGIRPDYAAAHLGLATMRMLQGDFEQGWRNFEWRWKTGQLPEREFFQPPWDGAPLPSGATILLHCEQGFGDAIQFVRYAPIVKQSNPSATVVVECEPPLTKLFASVRGVDRIVPGCDTLPSFDTYAPLLSLPRILNTRLDTIPRNVPYLFAQEDLINLWRLRLSRIDGFRIGINWHGRENHPVAQQRDLPLDQLASLANIAGVRLISLQKGAGQRELAGDRYPIVNFADELDGAHGAFMDTAAIMMNLDLVITSDTSIAHLAGALGVPVWVGLPFVPDWRWLLDRSDSPWYPTMRLFRQPALGDWPSVLKVVKESLREVVNARSRHDRPA